jgi:hypothetical protein
MCRPAQRQLLAACALDVADVATLLREHRRVSSIHRLRHRGEWLHDIGDSEVQRTLIIALQELASVLTLVLHRLAIRNHEGLPWANLADFLPVRNPSLGPYGLSRARIHRDGRGRPLRVASTHGHHFCTPAGGRPVSNMSLELITES